MMPPATPPHRRHPHANSGYPAASSPIQRSQSPPAPVVMPGPLAYASTPARPYTPVPPPSLVAFSPYSAMASAFSPGTWRARAGGQR
jgi:hypothetical protein